LRSNRAVTDSGATNRTNAEPESLAGRRPRWVRNSVAAAVVIAVVAATFIFGIHPRLEATAALKKATLDLSVVPVSVIRPKRGSPAQELVLPGNMQPFIDTPIFARTNGYLKLWKADIGAHVKAGELLAEIDAPEVDAQLQQARADLATAEANFRLAQTTATRWQALLKSDSVSKQEADQTYGDMEAKKAALDSARFNVARLEKLQSFKKIFAPFDGVITARNTDVGALIDAGNGGQAKELFHIAATNRLRVYVSVPQANSRDAVPGVEADLTLDEFPGRRFKGTLVRNTQAIDAASRTLLAEVDVDNPNGELLPGAYAQVHLKLHASNMVLVVPVNTLIFRSEGVQLAVVQPDQRVALRKIVLGRDLGTEVEVVSGLEETDAVIVNPSDSLASGTQVRVVKEPADKKPG
jgi:RND family efflux transporter MFP subunit